MHNSQSLNRRRFGALVAGSAFALPAVRAFAQEGTPPPADVTTSETAPQLPAADLPTMNEQGHLFEVSSTFTGSFADLPTEAPVYTMTPIAYTQESLQAIAADLNIDSEVTDQGGDSFAAEGEGGSLYVTNGRVQFISSAEMEDGAVQDDTTAIATAREWLRTHGLLPADVGEGAILSRLESPSSVMVGFKPIQPTPLISANPNVTVTMGPNGAVIEATNGWSDIRQDVVYQLRGADSAWEEVESRRAWIDASLPTDVFEPGATIGGAVEYSQISLAYTTSGIPGETQYLQPVYVFHGSLTPDGSEDTYPVLSYVPGLINANQPVG